jgi:hypothetical protein
MGVTIVNTKGMAFIGPGSEWFWAALQFTALLITFIAIYRQLRIARSASAIRQAEEQMAEWDGERMRRQRLAILVATRDGTQIRESGGVAVGNYFERLAMLARKGHLDTKVLWGAISTSIKLYWVALDPFVKSSRADYGDGTYATLSGSSGQLTGWTGERRAGSPISTPHGLPGNCPI